MGQLSRIKKRIDISGQLLRTRIERRPLIAIGTKLRNAETVAQLRNSLLRLKSGQRLVQGWQRLHFGQRLPISLKSFNRILRSGTQETQRWLHKQLLRRSRRPSRCSKGEELRASKLLTRRYTEAVSTLMSSWWGVNWTAARLTHFNRWIAMSRSPRRQLAATRNATRKKLSQRCQALARRNRLKLPVIWFTKSRLTATTPMKCRLLTWTKMGWLWSKRRKENGVMIQMSRVTACKLSCRSVSQRNRFDFPLFLLPAAIKCRTGRWLHVITPRWVLKEVALPTVFDEMFSYFLQCPLEWFHYPCVGITHSPKGKWYCPM